VCLAVPGRLVSVDATAADALRTGRVDFGGAARTVSLALLPEARVGDYVLVHVGVAIARVDEAEALKVFEYLREIEELEGEPAP
jgi:hydrogenase expression/formation protein HypC